MGEMDDGRSAAMAGCIASLAGTFIAYMFIPTDPAARGALLVPALLLAGGILSVPVFRFLSGSKDTLNAENIVAFGFVYWILLDLIQGAYDLYDASDEAIRYAFVSIGISAASMWIGVYARPWRTPHFLVESVSIPLENATLVKMVLVCFTLGMSNFVYAVNFDLRELFSYFGEGRWSAPWSRGQLGGWGAFLEHTQYFGYALPSLAILLVVRRGWLKPECLFALAAAATQVAFLSQGGGRRVIGVTVGAAILVWMLSQPGFKIKKGLGVVVGVIGLLWSMQFMLEIRSQGYEAYVESGSRFERLHVDDNFLRLAQVIEMLPDRHPYVYLQPIVFALIRPIPRVFWESKPIDPGFDLPSELGIEGVSLSTSIIGEWYMSFGWLAVIFGGWLHGRLASAANALRGDWVVANNPIVFALAVMVLVSGLRSMQDLIIMSYAILAWIGAAWLIVHRPR